MIDLSGLDGAIDPRALLARHVQLRVDELLPHLPETGHVHRERFLDLLMGFSLSAEALHAAARGEAGTCAEHMDAAQRHLGIAARSAGAWPW